MPLFIDVLRDSPNARVVIDATASGGARIVGFVMSDFVFSGRNYFNSAMEALLGGAGSATIGKGNSIMSGAISAYNLLGGQAVSRTLSGGDSTSAWIGSDRPKFTLPLLFLAVNPGDNPLETARQLMQFVYPTGNPNGVLIAPLNYVPDFYSRGGGCVGVQIGNWFRTPRLFIVKSVQLTISQRTDPGGMPLYVGATVEFEAQRTMVYDEVASMFAPLV